MSRFENFLEACDGSGKIDGKGKKKQKRKGKDKSMMDESILNEAKSPKEEIEYWIKQLEKSKGYKEDCGGISGGEWVGPFIGNIRKSLKKL